MVCGSRGLADMRRQLPAQLSPDTRRRMHDSVPIMHVHVPPRVQTPVAAQPTVCGLRARGAPHRTQDEPPAVQKAARLLQIFNAFADIETERVSKDELLTVRTRSVHP